MAKWGIRFQRFALSFRLSALDVCRFRSVLQPLALSLQPLLVFWAMPKGNPLSTNINTTIPGTDPFKEPTRLRPVYPFTHGTKEACHPSVK
jgi:hypothetical protein